MSLVRYNSVSLEVVKVHSFQQRPVYTDDNVDYLYTHFVLHCRCVFHPQATDDGNNNSAALSVANLRANLLAPRKTLTFAVGGQTILNSPQLDGATVDANNGPHPIGCDVVEIHGTKTIIVDYLVETWVKDCSTANAIIAHRWEAVHDYDERYLQTRIINGVVVFRSDVLQKLSHFADYYRKQLEHPIPPNSKRVHASVRADSDGVTYRYTIVDRQQYLTITGNLIVSIEGTYHSSFDMTSAIQPIFHEGLDVTVVGHREVMRADVVRVAATILAAWGFDVNQSKKLYQRAQLDLGINEKIAHMSWQRIGKGLVGLIQIGIFKAGAGLANLNDIIREDMPPIALQNLTNQIKGISRPHSDAEKLITQALTAPCAKPALPPAIAKAQDV